MSVIDEDQTIVTERLVLHPLRLADADEMVEVLGDPQLYEFTGGRPLRLDELRRRYRRIAAGCSADRSEIWLNWVVRLRATNVAVGTVQATVTSVRGVEQAQIAWVVSTAWQKLGIATEAIIALVAWLGRGGIGRISANVHPRHGASQKVASRAGLLCTHEILDGEQVWRLPEQRQPP